MRGDWGIGGLAGLSLAVLLWGGCEGLEKSNLRDGGVTDAAMADGGEVPAADEPIAYFVLSREGGTSGFFDLPWPTDIRRTDAGTIDVEGFPNPKRVPLIAEYIDAVSDVVSGYSLRGAAYFRFGTNIDVTTLPSDLAASTDADARVFLVNVDPDSPERGTRHPFTWRFVDDATIYWPAHTLALHAPLGLVLHPDTMYAAVVTRGITAADGTTLARDEDLDALLADTGDSVVAVARERYRPALDTLTELGVTRDDILSLAVFTTQDALAELERARDWVVEEYPAPNVRPEAWDRVEQRAEYTRFRGRYGPSPIVQEGELPYSQEGGAIRFEDGVPVLQGSFDARFSLSVPRTPMPDAGYPVVLYAHGTGGDFETPVRNGVCADLGRDGLAVLGIDQLHHGPRNPSDLGTDLLVYNFANPDAFRDNARQAALDVVQQARVIAGLEVPNDLEQRDGETIHFDPDQIYFYGHSQGGLNGPLFLAIDDHARGAVLSGAGANLELSLLEKLEPVNIPEVLRLILRLTGGSIDDAFGTEQLAPGHPVLVLLQTFLDVADPGNYAHRFFVRPRDGFAPKHILQTEGISDPFTPPGTIEALAIAGRIPLLGPELRANDAMRFLALGPAAAPVSGNVAGGATAGLVQYTGGHFVAFEPAARTHIRAWFRSLADGTPAITPH